MEIIPLIPERDVAIQRAWVAQDRDVRTQAKACLLLGRYHTRNKVNSTRPKGFIERALAQARSVAGA